METVQNQPVDIAVMYQGAIPFEVVGPFGQQVFLLEIMRHQKTGCESQTHSFILRKVACGCGFHHDRLTTLINDRLVGTVIPKKNSANESSVVFIE